MRLGIDGRSLESNPAGIGRYFLELAKCLDTLLPDAHFVLYTQNPLKMNPISERWVHRHEPSKTLRKVKGIAWLEWFAGRLCKQDALDVFWAPATFWPSFLPKRIKVVSSVHDLNHVVVPETMPSQTLNAYRLFFAHDVRRADAVVATSHATAARLFANNQVKAFRVVLPGVSANFHPRTPEIIKKARIAYGLGEDPYILALSTLEPRKNLVNLLHAFTRLKRNGELAAYKLVLVGGSGWKMEALDAILQDEKGQVVRCGYVPDEDLPALYSGASLFVFPSIYEGFGIPVLEAAACGTPILATDIPEIREAAQGRGIFVGTGIGDIESGLQMAIQNVEEGISATIQVTGSDWQTQAKLLVEALLFANSKQEGWTK